MFIGKYLFYYIKIKINKKIINIIFLHKKKGDNEADIGAIKAIGILT